MFIRGKTTNRFAPFCALLNSRPSTERFLFFLIMGVLMTEETSSIIPDPNVILCRGHTNYVRSMALSPDGKLLVSGSNDGTVRIWDMETGKEIRYLSGHTDFVHSVTFSSDGALIASGSEDKTVRIWDVKNGVQMMCLQGHFTGVESVIFSPNKRFLISVASMGDLLIWDLNTKKVVKKIIGLKSSHVRILLSEDGKTVLLGTNNVSGESTFTISILDFGNPNLGTLPPEESTFYV